MALIQPVVNFAGLFVLVIMLGGLMSWGALFLVRMIKRMLE